MNCKTCGYALWDLSSRTCPECGTGFEPSEFEFNLNSVRYLCPHCRQDYYGTGAGGHLVPSAFDCVRCGQHIHMDEMVLLPTEGVQEDQTRADVVPWLDGQDRQRKFRFFKCLFSTIGMALVRPQVLGRVLPHRSSLWRAQLFAVLTSLGYQVVGFGAVVVLGLAVPLMGGGFGAGGVGQALIYGLTAVAVGVAAMVIWTVVMLWLWALVAHALLVITGAKPKGSLGDTAACLAYAHGAGVVNALPCMGQYVGWIWPLVSGTIIVKTHHGVGAARATLAVVGPPVFAIVAGIAAYMWLLLSVGVAQNATIVAPRGTTGGAGAGTVLSAQDETRLIAEAARVHGETLGGPWGAEHMLVLVRDDHATAWDFIAGDTESIWSNVPLGDTTLGDLDIAAEEGSLDEQLAIAFATMEPLPEDVIAHRLGDFVFTGHGVDFSRPRSGVWTVVLWPDPDQHTATPNDMIIMIDANGGVLQIPRDGFDGMLSTQNVVREQWGLPALPHFDEITHAEPAVAD